ncbi:hypothetical protein B0H14DRAFT_3613948 [Mycena olivaceomarginata]|nr:hypothetical protein B0H14DRAFT_3613948 [Mycena olivaceomarginata]
MCPLQRRVRDDEVNSCAFGATDPHAWRRPGHAHQEAYWAEQPVRGYKWWGRAASAQCIASRAVDEGGGSRHDGAAARRTSEGTEERRMTRRGPREDVQQAARRHALLRPALDADTTRGDAEHRTRGRQTCSDALMWRGDYVDRRYGCVAGGGR